MVTRWVPIAFVALSLAAASGCAAQAQLGAGDRDWREVRTERILLLTDLDEATARERASDFERLAAALGDLYAVMVPRRGAPVRPIRVIHLASCAELRRRYGENVGGFVTNSADFGRERLVVTCEFDGSLRTETVVHELTHDLNHRYLSDLPSWLEEGLATYYQTLRLEERVAVLGLRPQMDRRFWRGVAILPGMQELMGMSQEQLVGLGERRGYFAAWKLTHLLANGSRDHLSRFRRMLAAFASGQGKAGAFAAAYGDVADQVASDYKGYHLRSELTTWRVPYSGDTAPRIRSERLLRPVEVHALFIELGPFYGERSQVHAAVRDLLERIERTEPKWPRRLYWRALVQLRLGTGKESPVDLLRRYLQLEPDDGQAWLGLVQLELARLRPRDHLGVEPQPPPGLEVLEDEVMGLVRVSTTPSQLNQVGWYYALRRRPETGLNFALRALELEPGDGDTWDTLALLYFHAGRGAEAVAAQKRAIALMAESRGGISSGVRARLRHYERAASAAPAP